ncbi:MAG: ACP phosphodiesterase [Kangiellaceae bacterium]|jgi:acyl carrier protein phosphodiesterase|nr:ACP phosphodiesterase [Kangiellaceae bacterium]
MNWLAHIVLSHRSIDYQVGNLLADPFKGKTWPNSTSMINAGFKMHSSIDSFTDSHPLFLQSKKRLGEKGYLKAVVIDVTYDHLLLKHWQTFVEKNSTEFINNFYSQSTQQSSYPTSAMSFLKRVAEHKVLSSYDSIEGLSLAFSRIEHRLSKRVLAKDNLLNYMPRVMDNIDLIEHDFLLFFPELVDHFKQQSGFEHDEHWLR